MRVLNKKQKKAITEWFNKNWDGQGSLYTIDQMPIEEIEKIEEMGFHETFYCNADRFINDLACDELYKKRSTTFF